MRFLRRILVLTTLELTVLITVLSIVGAFLGVESARSLFNSIPLALVWIAFTLLLVVGLVVYRSLNMSVGLLAIHAGPILILTGAMAGSVRGHEVAESRFGRERIPSGYMQIFEGEASRTVHDEEGREIGRLPFELVLEDFDIDYYGGDQSWSLEVEAPFSDRGEEVRAVEIEWSEGMEVELPFVRSTLKVLRYLPSARPAREGGDARVLEVVEASGARRLVPAEAGREVRLEAPLAKLTVEQVFSHLLVRDGEVVDVEGMGRNPAVKVSIEGEDGTRSQRYVFASGMMGHGQEDDGLALRYLVRSAASAEPDPATGLPAMEVSIREEDGRETRRWLIAQSRSRPVVLPLGPLPDAASAMDRRGMPHGAFLLLTPRRATVRQFTSTVEVRGNGVEPLRRDVRVNGPLHFGGYHFYQHSYDSQNERYTVLAVKSDAGLAFVYAGFVALCCGMFWLCWIRPAIRHFSKERASGNQDEH